MKAKLILSLGLGLMLVSAASAADERTVLTAQPGSKVKMDGTSTMHDWTVNGVAGGTLELDSKFLADPTKAQPGKISASAEAVVPVRQLKSYMTKMDTVMYQALKQQQFPKIEYRLTELTLKETPKSAEGPFVFDSKGTLAVAGKTNDVAFPVTMTRSNSVIKTVGGCTLKMTDYGVTPPSPAFLPIKTGNEVKLSFEWLTAPKAP
jgi:polyisoprenoid-binding protein YceI